MVVSLNVGPTIDPQKTIILFIGTSKRVPLILPNPHILLGDGDVNAFVFVALNPKP